MLWHIKYNLALCHNPSTAEAAYVSNRTREESAFADIALQKGGEGRGRGVRRPAFASRKVE